MLPEGNGDRAGRTLIVAETMASRLTAFDVRADGSLGNRRVFAELPRVREGGAITDRIDLDTHAYAVMLGGPQRRHLFMSTSDSHDPIEIASSPSATLRVVEVNVAGAGIR